MTGSLAIEVSAGAIAEAEAVTVPIEEPEVEPQVLFDVGTAVPVVVAVAVAEVLKPGTAVDSSEAAGRMPPCGRENASRGSNETTNRGEECIVTAMLQ